MRLGVSSETFWSSTPAEVAMLCHAKIRAKHDALIDMMFVAYHAAVFFHAPKKAHNVYKQVVAKLKTPTQSTQTSEDHLKVFEAAFPRNRSK